MDFGLNEEQQQLKVSARDFLKNECATSFVRQTMADKDGMPREFYGKLAELGWTGLIVPEQFGGAGLAMLDLAVVLEECGYAAMPGPFLFSAIATAMLNLAGAEAAKQWLPGIASGKTLPTFATGGFGDSLDPEQIGLSCSKQAAGYVLNGTSMFVPYAHIADLIVALARDEGGQVALLAVDGQAAGVQSRNLAGVDLTRRISEVKFDNVRLAPAAYLGGGAELYRRIIDVGAVAIAADSLGGTERALEMAVDYSKVREQFGKPIGSFQALKHAAAEIVADLEPARALLWYAAYAQEAVADDASRAASMAKARLCEIYSRSTDRAVLMHGGIGFTWEHDIHLWFKRARFNEPFFGDPALHRERLAQLAGY